MKITNIILFFLGCIAHAPNTICMSKDAHASVKRKHADTEEQQAVQLETLETLSYRVTGLEASLANLLAQFKRITNELAMVKQRSEYPSVRQIPASLSTPREVPLIPKVSPSPEKAILSTATPASEVQTLPKPTLAQATTTNLHNLKMPPNLADLSPQQNLDRGYFNIKKKLVSSAIPYLEKAAQQTSDLACQRRAQTLLGGVYMMPHPVHKDFSKALSHLIPIATQTQDLRRLSTAQLAIGEIYLYGDRTIRRNFGEALPYLKFAFAQTNNPKERAVAALLLGIMHLLDNAQDFKMAKSFYLPFVKDSSYADIKSTATTILDFLDKQQIDEARKFVENFLNSSGEIELDLGARAGLPAERDNEIIVEDEEQTEEK